jgi:hypothetical protein
VIGKLVTQARQPILTAPCCRHAKPAARERWRQTTLTAIKPSDRWSGSEGGRAAPQMPTRFYGSVETARSVKAFDAILNVVVMELQRTSGAKVRLALEVEAEASSGFRESEIDIVHDNARQLKFKPEATGFG